MDDEKKTIILQEGESILRAEKRLEEGIDDFENCDGEEEFLKKLETGEEAVEHEQEIMGQS